VPGQILGGKKDKDRISSVKNYILDLIRRRLEEAAVDEQFSTDPGQRRSFISRISKTVLIHVKKMAV